MSFFETFCSDISSLRSSQSVGTEELWGTFALQPYAAAFQKGIKADNILAALDRAVKAGFIRL